MKKKLTGYVFLLLFQSFCFAQTKLDSLQNVLKMDLPDTLKVNVLNDLFLGYEFSAPAEAGKHLSDALALAQKNNFKTGLAKTYKHLGFFAEDKGNYPEAIKYYFASLKVYAELVNAKGMVASYNGIGSVYFFQKNYSEALKNYFYGLALAKKSNDLKGIATSYNNIGNVYAASGKYEDALTNLFSSLKIDLQIGNKSGVAYSYNNIGNVYENQAHSLKQEEKKYDDKLNDALKSHSESLRIKEELNDKPGIASSFGNIGRVYLARKQYADARKYLNKSVILSKSIGYRSSLKNSYKSLMTLDSAQMDFKGAFANHKLYILYQDSLDNEDTREKTLQNQMTYDFERKEAVAAAEHKKELESQHTLSEEKSTRQRIIIGFVIGGLLLVIVFSGFVFRSLRYTRKQKNIIEAQKRLVEDQKNEVETQKDILETKQQEIIDSITYARRIQRSLMPTEKYIEKNLNKLKKR